MENPFQELPEALVEGMLSESHKLSDGLVKSFTDIRNRKDSIRHDLIEKEGLTKDVEILSSPTYPTTSASDGAYAIEKLLSMDLLAIAAVAVEGLTPPTEQRIWLKPHFRFRTLRLARNDATNVVARAIMMCMELELARLAPHDVVFLDGSLTTPFIYLNQGLTRKDEVPELSEELNGRVKVALESYRDILLSSRTDKIFAALPKYSTKKEITDDLKLTEYDDRALLSLVMDGGEFVGPKDIKPPKSPWHIKNPPGTESIVNEIITGLEGLQIMYYRPYVYSPALRIEVSASVATNRQRLAVLLEAVRLQSGAAGLMEPYPLYLADRMVKHLSTALPAIRSTVTQQMGLKLDWPLDNVFIAMHGYRTESGR